MLMGVNVTTLGYPHRFPSVYASLNTHGPPQLLLYIWSDSLDCKYAVPLLLQTHGVHSLTTCSLHALRLDDTPYCTGARCAIINQLQLSIYLLLSITCKHALRGEKAEYPVNKLSCNDTGIFFEGIYSRESPYCGKVQRFVQSKESQG
jgi:hypothetical protein